MRMMRLMKIAQKKRLLCIDMDMIITKNGIGGIVTDIYEIGGYGFNYQVLVFTIHNDYYEVRFNLFRN